MAGAINFASPNYHESQPFPIEAPLATTVATNPAAAGVALPLLLSYMSERQSAESGYQDQINQQHQLALGALQENQRNNARERLIDIMKNPNPGMLGMAASNPLTAPLVAGTDPNAMRSMNEYANRAALSKILSDTGRGAQGLLAGGIQPDVGAIGNLTGLPMAPGTPPIVDAAKINAASRVSAAQIGAGARDTTVNTYTGGNQTPVLSVTTQHGHTNLPQAPAQNTSVAPQSDGNISTHLTLGNLQHAAPAVVQDIAQGAMKNGGHPQMDASGRLVGGSGKVYP